MMIAANHTLHLDNGIILKSIPARFRRRLAIAASDHMWRSPIRSLAIPLLGNGFPFSKEEMSGRAWRIWAASLTEAGLC